MFESLAAEGMDQGHDDIKDIYLMNKQHRHDYRMQDTSYQYQRELNEQMAGIAADARRSSAPDMVAGLRAAGLNPAIAGGGTAFGSVASGGGVPAPSTSTPFSTKGTMGKLALETLKYYESERKLIESQTNLNNANAEGVKSETALKDYELATYYDRDRTIQSMCTAYADAVERDPNATAQDKALAKVLKSETLSAGSLEGVEKYLHTYGYQYETLTGVIDNKLKGAVLSDQFSDPDVRDAFKRMPEAQFDSLIASVAEYMSVVSLNATQSDLNEAEKQRVLEVTNNLRKEFEKLEAEISNVKADTSLKVAQKKATQHGDLIQSMQVDPIPTVMREAYTLTGDLLKAYAMAKGGGTVLSNLGGGKAPRLSESTKTTTTIRQPTIITDVYGRPIGETTISNMKNIR